MILCYMAVQNLRRLKAIRASSRLFKEAVEMHYAIFLDAFTSRSSVSLYKPAKYEFQNLFRVARRCQISKELSSALADELLVIHPSLPLTRLERSSYDRFIKNVQPYLLALGHFLERYRDRLAKYSLTNHRPVSPIPCIQVEHSILSSSYDAETVYRICVLYDMLKRILDHDLNAHAIRRRPNNMFDLHNVSRRNYTDSLDIFIFGGLEAVKDFLAEPDPGNYPFINAIHLARACPHVLQNRRAPKLSLSRLPKFSPSTLPELDQLATQNICQLLPNTPQRILNLRRLPSAKFSAARNWRKRGLDRFY